jgi:hypothetical protein
MRAAPAARAGAIVVNVLIIVIAAGAGLAIATPWALAAGRTAGSAWLTGAVCAIVAGLCVGGGLAAALERLGSTVGHRVSGLRVVDERTGMPGALTALLSGYGITTDVRLGRDPLQLIPRPLAVPAPPPPPPAPEAIRQRVFTLVSDDGTHHPITAPTLIGRRAADPTGRYAILTIADVSGTLSRRHAIVTPTPHGLEVVDLGSTNGSSVQGRDGEHEIAPNVPMTVVPGMRLYLGNRAFQVVYE